MATTGIWKIAKRLDHVIDYTTNAEKTMNSSYGEADYKQLHNVIEYATAEYKTEKQCYVSGINCSPESALEEMSTTKKQFCKTEGILGFHAFQSFVEGEVTPEKAHTIGVRLAEEMWGDRFEVIVSTHLNTKHIHNHFVLNSVSFMDGKRYYDKRETYSELRHLSDSICEEMGISVLKEKPCRRSKINYANYYNGTVEKSTYHTIAKEDIDRAVAQAYSYKDFENLLETMGYKLYYRADKLSVRRYPYKRNIRIVRSFGDDYSIDRLKERIDTTHAPREPFPEAYNERRKYYEPKTFDKKKYKGIYGLYLHYCYLLKVFPQEYPHKRLPPSIRVDVEKLEAITKETTLLISNGIITYEQFLLYKSLRIDEIDNLQDMRSKLWYKHKKSTSNVEKNSIRSEIDSLSEKIEPIKKILKLCDGIEERVPIIENNLKEVGEEIKRKERKL